LIFPKVAADHGTVMMLGGASRDLGVGGVSCPYSLRMFTKASEMELERLGLNDDAI
jgi:hypothetical protein